MIPELSHRTGRSSGCRTSGLAFACWLTLLASAPAGASPRPTLATTSQGSQIQVEFDLDNLVATPARHELTYENLSPDESIGWQIDAISPWLSLAGPTTGILAANDSMAFIVGVDVDAAALLGVGVHTGTFVVSSANQPDQAWTFVLNSVSAQDGLEVRPVTPMQVVVDATTDVPTLNFFVENASATRVPWSVATVAPWLSSLGRSSGQVAPGQTVRVAFDVDESSLLALGSGVHVAPILFQVGSATFRRNVDFDVNSPTGNGRVMDGLVAYYDFEEGVGQRVNDSAPATPPMHLDIEASSAVSWLPGALRVDGDASIISPGPASTVIDRCKASGEITIEAWLTPETANQAGPARIVTISNGTLERNVTLGHGDGGGGFSESYDIRLRATGTTSNGMPSTTTPAGSLSPELQHVVFTRRSDGSTTVYIDGQTVSGSTASGSLTNWNDSYRLALGNEVGAPRAWSGTFHLVALYDRALTPPEVDQNFAVGPLDGQAGVLSVMPLNNFVVIADVGDDLSGESQSFDLGNAGTESIQWTASASESWVVLDGPTSGTLAPNGTTSLTVRLDLNQVATFGEGTYDAELQFSSSALGTTSRDVVLRLTTGGGGPGGNGNTSFETSVSHNGITWTFDGPYEVGQFVTGDYFVVGPVVVSSVSPGSTSSSNGSMVNPPVALECAYDSGIPYSEMSLRESYPLTLQPGESLVSTKSHPGGPPYTDLVGQQLNSFSHLERASVLTCLDAPVASTFFRPPLCGNEKPLYDSAGLDFAVLPRLTRTGGTLRFADTDGSEFEDYARAFERPWLVHVRDWVGRQSHPTMNMPNYHHEVYDLISDAAVLLISDVPVETKRPLAIGFIQVGIDMYHAGAQGFPDSSYHKWPVILAGYLLGVSEMRSPAHNPRTDWMTYRASNGSSPHTSSIVPANQGWTGATLLYRQDPGQLEHEHLHPTEWDFLGSGSQHGRRREWYRRSNSSTWPGAALAARVMGLEDAWDHDPFFGYVDRWMAEDDEQNFQYLFSLFGEQYYVRGKSCSSSFVKNMWFTHR